MINAVQSIALYQVLLLGVVGGSDLKLRREIEDSLSDLGLPSCAIIFIAEVDAHRRDLRNPVMAVFFGEASVTRDTPLLTELIEDSVVIVPVVSDSSRVHAEIPPQLRHINAFALTSGGGSFGRLATLVLETFLLLRSRRRLFISYKRSGSQPLAHRLYDALDARGFDVFIDVRSVPPATDFQSELWHRMTDSDIIVLIDTPGFREGRWTAAELAQANATSVQILHLLWPGQAEDPMSAFSHFLKLSQSDFFGHVSLRGQFLKRKTLNRICDEAERLRARALAARQRYLIDNFCDSARDLGLMPAVQVDGWISVSLPSGERLAVVPTVGVPTSDRINEIFDSASRSGRPAKEIWVVYDNRGVLKKWLSHLEWLDEHLPVRSIQMSNAPNRLADALK
jgi:hypothetical protein